MAPNSILFLSLSFQFDIIPNGIDYSKVFTLTPQHNMIYAADKSHTVTVLFKPDREMELTDPPVLKCQVDIAYHKSLFSMSHEFSVAVIIAKLFNIVLRC